LRVYRSERKGVNNKTPRVRTTRPKKIKTVEESSFVWRREPLQRTAKEAVSHSERVDKLALGEVAKLLEKSKRLEESQIEARSTLRGRRMPKQHRSTGVLPKVAATRSSSRGALNRGDTQFSWRREPTSSLDVGSNRRAGKMAREETPLC
jgi:hypothetical protein